MANFKKYIPKKVSPIKFILARQEQVEYRDVLAPRF